MHAEISKMVEDYDRGQLTRRQLVTRLADAAAMAGASLRGDTPAAAQQTSPTFQATGVDHIALSVSDIARSRQFYEQHLGLQVTRCDASTCFLQSGEDF
ncbi:MAG: VOC family protein, partial [Acidobacteriota bacterium]